MWEVTATQDDESWMDNLIDEIVHDSAVSLPSHDQHIASIEVHWHQTEPKEAFVVADPRSGSFEDQQFVESIVMAQLEPFGYRRAMVPMRWNHLNPKYADWTDVENKAKRLVQQGRVHINRNGYNVVQAVVQGDGTDNDGKPDTHQVELRRDDPDSQSLTNQFCDCGWGGFMNTPRTRTWKQFQNRSCSHCLATYWQSLATPLDEDRAPGDMGAPGQMSMPMGDMGPMQAPRSMGLMQNAPMENMQQNPNMGMGAGGMPPAPEDVLPPFPMANQPQVNPDSVPGLKPGPTPANPLQYPGQTYSKIAVDQQYQNGDLVQLRYEDVGTWMGRSEEHGAGQQVTIPAGSVGEVLGTDPSTGMVNALFMGQFTEQNVELEPFGAVLWSFPSELVPRPDLKKPGPAFKRR